MGQKVIDIIGIAVTLVWAVSNIATIFDHSYNPPASINAIMSAVVGAYGGAKAFGQFMDNRK